MIIKGEEWTRLNYRLIWIEINLKAVLEKLEIEERKPDDPL